MGDVIFALASGAGRGAIAVVRVSGAGTEEVLRQLAGGVPAPRRAALRKLRAAGGEVLDHALVLWFPGPRSYSGEDSGELHLHGGAAVIAGVAEELVRLGARPAEAGEFTRRAFLNGRLDLTEVEGLADLIAAETAGQRRQALEQAGGALARQAAAWTDRCARLLAHQEAAIEFAEDDLPNDLAERARAGADALRGVLEAALHAAPGGERLREGLSFAILGAPNAGKSSLLNALAGREAAMTSPLAGTTRDVIEVRLDLGGVPVTLADTAGLREAADSLEAEGIRRALARAESADLRLAVFAADVAPDPATLALLGPDTMVVVAKSDLAPAGRHPALDGGIRVSTLTGMGLDALHRGLQAAAISRVGEGTSLLTRPRHRAALGEAAGWLAEASTAALPELTAEALRAALRALGRLSGRVGVEDILDIVFKDFCIGK